LKEKEKGKKEKEIYSLDKYMYMASPHTLSTLNNAER